jgi:hypothetical protein
MQLTHGEEVEGESSEGESSKGEGDDKSPNDGRARLEAQKKARRKAAKR